MRISTDHDAANVIKPEWIKLFLDDVTNAKTYAIITDYSPLEFLGIVIATYEFIANDPTHAIATSDREQMARYRAAMAGKGGAPSEGDAAELLAAMSGGGFLITDGGDAPAYQSPTVNASVERIADSRENGRKGGKAKAEKRSKAIAAQVATERDRSALDGA